MHDCTSKPAAMIKPAELRSPPHSPGSPADEDSRLLGSPAKASPTASADDTTAMSATSVLQLTLFTTVTFTVAQIIAGHLSNSVSLQGDSADMVRLLYFTLLHFGMILSLDCFVSPPCQCCTGSVSCYSATPYHPPLSTL